MERPNRIILQKIKDCLDQLVELNKDCINTELPIDVQRRGIAIMNNLFKPGNIDDVDIETLKERLLLIEQIHIREQHNPHYQVAHPKKGGWFSRVSGLLFKEKPILAQHWGDSESHNNKNLQAVKSPFEQEKLSVYERTDSIHHSSGKYRNYKGTEINHRQMEKLSNLEMRSRLDERRLDGSPDPHLFRDGNQWGSYPPHDDYSENANP